jgi:thiosulfate reductase cytochrome b subunit
LPVRLWHWTNLVALIVLLGSGLQILDAHPRFYWGQYGANADPAILAFSARQEDGRLRGVTTIGARSFDTTGLLGVATSDGKSVAQAFPCWATLPGHKDLATGRLWHFFFAWVFAINGALFVAWGLVRRHIRRDLLPRRDQLAPRHIWHEIRDHARLRFARGEEARRYNILQKAAYLAVLFGLLPAMILTGLTMSPGVDAAWPWLLDLFGGRQSARTIHFISAMLLVGFFFLHIGLVLVSGVFNNLRSMITGRYAIDHEGQP